MLNKNIKKLVEYGVQTGLIPECERRYTTNLLLEIFQDCGMIKILSREDDFYKRALAHIALNRQVPKDLFEKAKKELQENK